MALNSYEQAERALLLAREYKLDADHDPMTGTWRIGNKRYYDRISITVAIISAFDRVGIPVPKEIKERPSDLD